MKLLSRARSDAGRPCSHVAVQPSHPALAVEQRSAAAIGKDLADAAIEGLSSGAAGAAINEAVGYFTSRDVADLDTRSLTAIENFLSNIFRRDLDERSAAAIGKAIAAGVASGALEAGVTSLVDKLSSREVSAPENFLGNAFKRDLDERSAAAIGKALADGAIDGLSAGAAGAAIDAVVDHFTKREVEERSAAAIGKAIAAGVASGALEAGVTSLVNDITSRDVPEISERDVEERSAAAIGKAVAAGVASGALEAGVTSLVDKLTSRDVPEARSLTAIENFFKNVFKRDVEERSAAAIGKAVAAGVASGALEAGVTSLVDKLTGRAMGDVFIDDSTGIIYADVDDGEAGEKRAIGAIVKGLATGAGVGVLKSVYDDLTSRSINELD